MVLEPIIKTLSLSARERLILRGHRYTGNLFVEQPDENNGNFRALLRLWIDDGDDQLKHDINNCPQSATYLVPQI